MNFKKTFGKLGSILLLSATITGTNLTHAGEIECTEFHEVYFNNEQIVFCRDDRVRKVITGDITKNNITIRTSKARNKIIVIRKTGRNIAYIDSWGDDYKVDQINIEENGKVTSYDSGLIIEEGQKEFDKYLKIIKESVAKDLLK